MILSNRLHFCRMKHIFLDEKCLEWLLEVSISVAVPHSGNPDFLAVVAGWNWQGKPGAPGVKNPAGARPDAVRDIAGMAIQGAGDGFHLSGSGISRLYKKAADPGFAESNPDHPGVYSMVVAASKKVWHRAGLLFAKKTIRKSFKSFS